MSEVRSNILNELSHFEGRLVEFPSELLVRLDAIPFRATAVAVGPDGTALVEISYDLLAPHTATYNYVGPSKAIELPADSGGDV
ncbi:MAG: hypothetical protein ABWY12_04265 [Burkholderiales bacterium]